MAQGLKKTDQLSTILVAVVAIAHLWAIHPFGWQESEIAQDVEVQIEVAATQPMASTSHQTTPYQEPPSPGTDVSQQSVAATPSVGKRSAAQPTRQGSAVPSTNVSYEVGSAKNPRPAYPQAAFAERIEGRVVVKIHVMPDGKVTEVQLHQSSGSAELDKSALDTLAKWELEPARKNGEPIDQWIEIPIHFRVLEK